MNSLRLYGRKAAGSRLRKADCGEAVVQLGCRACWTLVSFSSNLGHTFVSQGPKAILFQKHVGVWEVLVVRDCSLGANSDRWCCFEREGRGCQMHNRQCGNALRPDKCVYIYIYSHIYTHTHTHNAHMYRRKLRFRELMACWRSKATKSWDLDSGLLIPRGEHLSCYVESESIHQAESSVTRPRCCVQAPPVLAMSSGGVAFGTDSRHPAKLSSCLVAACSSRKRSWEQRGRHLIGQHAGVQTHLGGFLGWHISWCFSSACGLSLQLSWLSSFQKHCFYSPLCSLSLPSFQAAKDTPMVMVSSALLMLIVEGFRAIETCIVNRFRAWSDTNKGSHVPRAQTQLWAKWLAYVISLTPQPCPWR